ncbi:unnamed protein product [Agarophyton chilense]
MYCFVPTASRFTPLQGRVLRHGSNRTARRPLWVGPVAERQVAAPQTTPTTPTIDKNLPSKRICVFSDGSWNSPDIETLTNVSYLAQAVQYAGPSGVPQLVFYDQGVGTEGDALDKIKGGAMGVGIDLNIKQLYTFLVMNYVEGDEIYLFGFSRGAYTVRSLAGMMFESGLLYRNKLDFVTEAYTLYRENIDVESERAKEFRAEHARRVPITALVCFDTVGALGVPSYAPFPFSLFSRNEKYAFHDTTLSELVNNAIHVVSIDEEMVPFEPTLMSHNPKVGPSQLTQVYMPGRHGGIGGGNKQAEPLARNALKFVVDEMKRRGLALDVDCSVVPEEYVLDCMPKERASRLSLFGLVGLTMGMRSRKIDSLDSLHECVPKMYRTLKWRPGALEPFKEQLLGDG